MAVFSSCLKLELSHNRSFTRFPANLHQNVETTAKLTLGEESISMTGNSSFSYSSKIQFRAASSVVPLEESPAEIYEGIILTMLHPLEREELSKDR